MLSRKQEQFLQGLLLGKSIVDSAKLAEISERTAYLWLQNPLFQAERKRREADLVEAEQAEINRIMTTGYAATHNRVQALGKMALALEESLIDPETKKINPKWLYPNKLREWRGMLDDIAKELGQRKIKQEIEHSLPDLLDAEYDSLLAEMGGLPDAGQKQTTHETPETHSA